MIRGSKFQGQPDIESYSNYLSVKKYLTRVPMRYKAVFEDLEDVVISVSDVGILVEELAEEVKADFKGIDLKDSDVKMKTSLDKCQDLLKKAQDELDKYMQEIDSIHKRIRRSVENWDNSEEVKSSVLRSVRVKVSKSSKK